MASNAEKQPVQSRGRNVTSKPLREGTTTTVTGTPGHVAPTASSKFRSIPSGASSTSGTTGGSKAARTPSANSVASSKSSIRSSSSASKITATKAAAKTLSESEHIKVTKVSATTVKISSSSWTPPAPPSKEPPKATVPVPAPKEASQPSKADDPLQIAAQVYPWTYMSTTLDACFKTADDSANKELERRTEELERRESVVTVQKERAEAEQAIEFYDELESDVFTKSAPAIMQLFQSHGESCDKIEGEALKLANRLGPDLNDKEPLKPYTEMLDRLEELQTTAAKLRESIANLTEKANAPTNGITKPASAPGADGLENEAESNPQTPETAVDSQPSARTQISSVFSACLPVIKARIANLSMAQELIDMALENASLTLRMESMGIAD